MFSLTVVQITITEIENISVVLIGIHNVDQKNLVANINFKMLIRILRKVFP